LRDLRRRGILAEKIFGGGRIFFPGVFSASLIYFSADHFFQQWQPNSAAGMSVGD